MTVFALSWGTTALGYSREKFLVMQSFGIVFFALTIPIGAVLAVPLSIIGLVIVNHLFPREDVQLPD